MRIVTLNVNGIRSAHSKGFWTWMNAQKADVVCLQEIKAHAEVIPEECRVADGWHAHFHPAEKPGYSGVAIYSRHAPDKVHVGMRWPEMDIEGRYLQVDIGKLSVVSLYLPSGTSGETRQAFKYEFLERLETHLRDLRRRRREYVICGDFNIAHKEIDLKNWRGNRKNSGFLPDERAWMDRLFDDHGYVDAFRRINQQADQYTWWSNRGQARAKNVGWRIDYHVVSPRLKDCVRAASIYRDQRFSDHAPLTIDYDYDL
jgi:exodeoxyribonuclease-3